MAHQADNSGPTSELTILLSGAHFNPTDTPFRLARENARQWCMSYNRVADRQQRQTMLTARLNCPTSVQIEPAFNIEYGQHCVIGKGSFVNHNATFIDVALIKIGNQVLIGPNCIISSAVGRTRVPPTDYPLEESALPVTIGHRVWLGANCVVCAGVTIGDNAVIGAGSLVTTNIPANSIAYGVPASVKRKIKQTVQ